jgi:hypothetical protein
MLALMGEDKKALVLPGAWAGLSILLTLIAFLQLSLASIGRKIDGRAASETGGARPMAWFTSLTAMASIVILGIAVATTFEVSEMLLLFGLVPWASYGAWIGLLAGVLGLLTVIMVIRAKARGALAIGTLIGFLLTGFAAIGLAAFIISWGLSPI